MKIGPAKSFSNRWSPITIYGHWTDLRMVQQMIWFLHCKGASMAYKMAFGERHPRDTGGRIAENHSTNVLFEKLTSSSLCVVEFRAA